MSTEFNFERAWRELAWPAHVKLPQSVRELYAYIAVHGQGWTQNNQLDIPLHELWQQFEALEGRDLAVAARTIHFWGHWAHAGDVTLRYAGKQQLIDTAMGIVEFPVDTYGSHCKAMKAAKRNLEANQAGIETDEWTITSKQNGPDNRGDVGAYWKFSNFADQVLRSRLKVPRNAPRRSGVSWLVGDGALICHIAQGGGWSNNCVGWATRENLAKAREYLSDWSKARDETFADALLHHLSDADPDRDWFFKEFMDHVEGSKYDDAELGQLFQPLVEGVFRTMGVVPVNHKPHPFMVTEQHLAKSPGMMLDPTVAMCGHRGGHEPCRLSYAEHTADRVLLLQCARNLTKSEAEEGLQPLKEGLREYGLSGVAFVEHPQGYKVVGDDETLSVECTG